MILFSKDEQYMETNWIGETVQYSPKNDWLTIAFYDLTVQEDPDAKIGIVEAVDFIPNSTGSYSAKVIYPDGTFDWADVRYLVGVEKE